MSSSNDILDPDRQLSTYYQAGGIGSSNSDADLSALIDEGRSELDPDARAAIYQDAVKLAYDQAYFAWLVSNQDLYGLCERLTLDAAGRLQAARQGDERDRLSRRRTVRERQRDHGTLHRTTPGAGAGGHLRRDRVRVRHHPPDRRSREVHAAALGHRGAARRDARRTRPRPSRSRASSSTSSATWSGSTSVRAPTSAASRRCRSCSTTCRARSNWSALGMLLAVVLSIPLGVLASRKPGGPLDRTAHHAVARRALDAAVLPRLRAADRCSP